MTCEDNVHYGEARSFDNSPINYEYRGAGDVTAFFIHGWTCNREFWRQQFQRPVSGMRTVLIDLAGHGLSRASHDAREWTIDNFARDVVAVADQLDCMAVICVGHSMGGAVAIDAAVRLGPRCRLVLGADTFTDPMFYPRQPEFEIRDRLEKMADNYPAELQRMVNAIVATATPRSVTDWLVSQMCQTDRDIALASLRGLLEWDLNVRRRHVSCPIKTINARLLQAEESANFYAEKYDLSVVFQDGVGHFPMLEAPDAFTRLFCAALSLSTDHSCCA